MKTWSTSEVTRSLKLWWLLIAALVLQPSTCFVTRTQGLSGRSLHLFPTDQAIDILQQSLNTIQSAESPSDLVPLLPAAGAVAIAQPALSTTSIVVKSIVEVLKPKKTKNQKESESYRTYPEGQPATYELSDIVVPFEFGPAALVRPLLKQTQLETRKLKVVYDANRDGYDPLVFHSKVDGKGAAVVLCKVRGKWIGGYFGGWQKLRVNMRGGMACGNDLFDGGIQFGADALAIPLQKQNPRQVTSRLGQFFEVIPPSGRNSLLARPGQKFKVQELYVLTGVYEKGEDIPNSGGVLELGQF